MDCFNLDCDMTICVVYDNEEKFYPVHSFILSMASPVFHCIWKYDNFNSEPIRMTDTSYGTMELFLEYIYQRELKIDSFDDAWSLYYLGEKYLMSDLKKICLDYIKKTSDVHVFCSNYEIAKFYGLTNNDESFKMDILNNLYGIMESEDFMILSPESILMLLDENNLDIKESMLFLGVSKWLINFFNDEENVNLNETLIAESRPKLVEDVLSKIFFNDMSLEEFLGVYDTGLLTQEESHLIVKNLEKSTKVNTKEDEQLPWPQGFRRCKRTDKYKMNEIESSVLRLPWERYMYYDKSSQYCQFMVNEPIYLNGLEIVNIKTPPQGAHQFPKQEKLHYIDTIKVFVSSLKSGNIYSMNVNNIRLVYGEETLVMFDRRIKLEKDSSYMIRIKFEKTGARHCKPSCGVYFKHTTRFDFIEPFENRSNFPVKSIRFCREFDYKL